MFWKKKAKDIEEDNKELSKKPEYIVTVYDKLASTLREFRTFVATQERDPDDGLLYLVSKDKKFITLFPSRKNLIRSNKTIEELKKLIEDEKKRPVKDIENPLNKVSKLYKLELELYSLERPSGEFIEFTAGGRPKVKFVRHNSNFVPLVNDVNLNYIYIPSEPNLKDSLNSIIEKKEKYKLKKDKLKDILAALIWTIAVILTLGNAYWSYHNMKWADSESSIAKIQDQINANALVCSGAMAKVVDNNVATSQLNKDTAKLTEQVIKNLTEFVTPRVTNKVNSEVIK